MMFERDVVETTVEEPKLFFVYISNRVKVSNRIHNAVNGGKRHDDEEEICEIVNKKF